MMSWSAASSQGWIRSSARRSPSSVRPLFFRSVTHCDSRSRNRASKYGLKNGSMRRSVWTRLSKVLLIPFSSGLPVSARGIPKPGPPRRLPIRISSVKWAVMAPPFKVLAVDGGGIRGIIPAMILEAIEQREVILLRFHDDRTISEVAMLTGRTETAIKGLQHRAVGALARAMGVQGQKVTDANAI